jgi:SAM-dependent methyltransferase
MGFKEALRKAVVSQFIRPRGFGGWLAGWEMALRPSNRTRNAWAVRLLEVGPTDRVLEIGFGPGIAIRELSRLATRGYVCGIDHSAEMVRQARRRNARAVSAGLVDLRLGSAEELHQFDEPFDKVLAVNTLGMWRDPDARLRELCRLLAPGGRIAIVSQPRCPGATPEISWLAGRELVDRLERAGFTGIRSETLALAPPVVCVMGHPAPTVCGEEHGTTKTENVMESLTTAVARRVHQLPRFLSLMILMFVAGLLPVGVRWTARPV